ncbi:MAG: MBL fold metallo-hydrolase [Promethearchaeota archaeon]|nr:MAG: MBL fold metallo-hydrolase [Candidatus Lokiarchaeota archaeon]
MTSITIYGGLSTIGGNCILIEENDTRIMLDNGMCFSKENLYYKDFLNPRTNNALRDYLELGLVPKIPGIYGKDKIKDVCLDTMDLESQYLFEHSLKSYEEYLRETGKPFISALFITHAHLDHFRNIKFMAPEIPIYCSKITKKLLAIVSDLSQENFLKYSYYEIKERSGGFFPGCTYKDKLYQKRDIKIANPNKKVRVPEDDPIFEVEGFPVDHSIPGAMAFQITTISGKRIIYSGDIRFHGHKHEKENSLQFLNNIEPIPELFIVEGTRISDNDQVSEKEVSHRMIALLKNDRNLHSKLIFVTFPWKSISRFLTVYKVAEALNRSLIIQPKLAYTIHHLKGFNSLKLGDILEKENIKIYLPRKYSMTYSKADYVYSKYNLSPHVDWDNEQEIDFYNCLYEDDILVRAYDIRNNPSHYIFHLNFYELNELIDIQPPKGSYFFNLKTEPFDEEGELEEKVLLSWISKFNLDYKKEHYHASGHAPEIHIREMINKVNPTLIIPVHTENSEWFSKNFGNTLILEQGTSYNF